MSLFTLYLYFILEHPNIKLFITQGGIQSIDEAIYDHIPMLALPFFMDQLNNVERIVAKGLALSLDYKTMDKNTFKETILELIKNPKYTFRACKYYRQLENLSLL